MQRLSSRTFGFIFALLCGFTILMLSPRDAASQQTGGLPALERRVTVLEGLISALQSASGEKARAESAEAALQAKIDAQAAQLATLQTTIDALQDKTQAMTRVTDTATGKSTVRFTGVNVQIVSGVGATDSAVNGTGNLIIGYNETMSGEARTGSHNLILGSGNGYTSYGGLVAGQQNRILAPYASIGGGNFNTASGLFASITGGAANTASGAFSSVNGGAVNKALGYTSTVSAGNGNLANGDFASVSSGISNYAFANFSTVSGGLGNHANGIYSTVIGGMNNTASMASSVLP